MKIRRPRMEKRPARNSEVGRLCPQCGKPMYAKKSTEPYTWQGREVSVEVESFYCRRCKTHILTTPQAEAVEAAVLAAAAKKEDVEKTPEQ